MALFYEVYESQKQINKGTLRSGENFGVKWMGTKIYLHSYFPKSRLKTTFHPEKYPAENFTTEAVEVDFLGQKRWLALGRPLYFYEEDRVFVVSYGYQRLPINFPLTLKKMNVHKYPGTDMASAYESYVLLGGVKGEQKISMNEPLKYRGLTFYQSSYEKDDMGEIAASILSVNYDPGRFIKYLGSLLLVLGIILLFYFKKYIIAKGRR